jgi:hypothetical protein
LPETDNTVAQQALNSAADSSRNLAFKRAYYRLMDSIMAVTLLC